MRTSFHRPLRMLRSFAAGLALAISLGACGMGSAVGGLPGTGGGPYPAGNWKGVFNMKYVTAGGSTAVYVFHVDFRMRALMSDGVTAYYMLDHVSTDQSWFGCTSGCDFPPGVGTVQLPVDTLRISGDGFGFEIHFPNGKTLYYSGPIVTNASARTFSHSPGVTPTSRFRVDYPPGASPFTPLPAGSTLIETSWVFNASSL